MATRTVIIVGAGEAEQELIRRQLGGVAEVTHAEPDPAKAREKLENGGAPSVALLYLDQDPEQILELSRDLARRSGCAPIVVSKDRDPDTILRAMRSGVRDFAYLEGEEDDVRRAILGLGALEKAEGGEKSGQVIAAFSSKGGSGATTLATNLAGALVKDPDQPDAKVVLVDLDFQMGDAMVFLDLTSRYSFHDLLGNLERLDDELLHRSLTTHKCGLRVLGQSDQLEQADEIDGAGVARALAFLRRHYDYVVLDGLRNFGEHALAALDAADQIAVTMTQDIPALKNANRCLAVFGRLGYGSDKVRLVLNRYHKREKLDLDAISDALGAGVAATVANDFPTVIKAINEGQLLVESAPRARVTRDVRALLPVLGAAAEATPRRGLFGRRG